MTSTTFHTSLRKSLSALFAGYRAEWLNEQIFRLFSEPSYFPQLLTPHPCFLIGGRGSGKTTVLKCLSFEGQFAISGSSREAVNDWEFVGLYHRLNTNRLAAFQGPEVDERTWTRLFGHYVNLELCERVFRFLNWYASLMPDAAQLSREQLAPFAATMLYEQDLDQAAVASHLELSRLRFEALVNTIGDWSTPPTLTMQGAPIDALLTAVKQLEQFRQTNFFFLLDEYENLSDAQQRVCNTLIKHCGQLYSFKVGVRELGLRQRSTLNEHEQLTHPADYKRIDIADELDDRFSSFALEVCSQRLSAAFHQVADVPSIDRLLPSLSAEDEAHLLGVAPQAKALRKRLEADDTLSSPVRKWARTCSDLELFTLDARANAESRSLPAKMEEAHRNAAEWQQQYDNYKYAYLFAIRPRKRGIRKYYAGWHTYCSMAANNIRYLLELVDQALTCHLDSEADPLSPIPAKLQTEAAQFTGRKNLRELEGVSIHHGAKLTRILLGLGRVFQVMAEQPVGHTPEVNQFHVVADRGPALKAEDADQVDQLLTAAVMHLALLRYSGSKLQEASDIRQYDFAIHPIYAAFFGFSHRKKRKIPLAPSDIIGLIDNTPSAVSDILGRQQRIDPDELPDQLRLFEGFYAL